MTIPINPHAIVELFETQGKTEINKRRYDSWRDGQLLAQVAIELTTDQASEATIVVLDEDFRFTDRHLTETGMRRLMIRLWLGFGEDLGPSLFKGMLARTESDGRKATFVFHDLSTQLKQEKKTRYHNRTTTLQLLKKLALENKEIGNFSGPDTAVDEEVYDSLIQAEETDWEFARRIARRDGWVIWVQDDTLFCQEAATYENPMADLVWKRDAHLLHGSRLTYKLPENRRGKPKAVEVRGRGRGGGRLSGHSDESPRGQSQIEIKRDLPKHSLKAARRRAHAHKTLQREHSFEHTIRLLPSYQGRRIQVRQTIRLTGAGLFYSDRYIVDAIRYEYRPGSLTTDLSIYKDIERAKRKP